MDADMALKVELKPGEQIVIGNAVLKNGNQRAHFVVEGHAPILREKDILTAETANTPARRIYLAVQLMYLSGDIETNSTIYFELIRDFMTAAPSSLPLISEINSRILSGDLYKALKTAKRLVNYEKELLATLTAPAG
jgi:flagellar protein FlbT